MFDKKLFRKLLIKAMNQRTSTIYAKQSGINRTYISKLLNEKMDNPPSPEVLKGLASVAQNNVTYIDFMKAAGYIDSNENSLKNTDFTEEELKILEQIKNDPEISILFHDLKSAPKKKIKQLIQTWEFINNTFDEMEDEE